MNSQPGQTPTSDVVTILGWGKQGDTGGVSPDLKYVEVSLPSMVSDHDDIMSR